METQYLIADDAIVALNRWIDIKGFSSVFILTDSNSNTYCLPRVKEFLNKKYVKNVISLEDGEASKSIESCNKIWKWLLEKNADKDSLLINLGGGMITDLGGFAASVFKRGISFVNVPTTLMAMIDAAIGGKTAINLDNFKNQVGSFSVTPVVAIDPAFLNSLPERQLISGFAEILKYGLIADKQFWADFSNIDPKNLEKLNVDLILQCIEIKEDIVEEDFKDHGKRKILNFGHTIGHAFESLLIAKKKQALYHGEAVANGMLVECIISSKVTGFNPKNVKAIAQVIGNIFPKVEFSEDDIELLIKYIRGDKKNTAGKIKFVLLKNIGDASIDNPVSEKIIMDSLKEYLKL